ncbi:MAG: hypothetical protein DDT19_00205 [Syntrophomonadaceae bacterium]|nr:hypothetical protein [Bacillota bacterium]
MNAGENITITNQVGLTMGQKIDTRLAALIPTCRDILEEMHLDATLTALAMQSVLPCRIYVRDEGKIEMFRHHGTRMLWNLIAVKGVEMVYLRATTRKGVALARKELVEALREEGLVLFLDDDIVMQPDATANLMSVLDHDSSLGFVQGEKVELDPNRTYWNDINQLRGQDDKPKEPFQIYFGDAALLLLRREAMLTIQWDIVTKFSVEGLAGEDVAMTLMIADKYPCLGVPASRGWHISPSRERWCWEPSSDLLWIEQLKGVVSEKTLRRALPHLREFVK